MSDVIARMRLESQDFDNKLKSATANLQHMEREVRRTGATFEYADKEELAFLQSLGQMETKAMDAKGKIKELSNSYKELAMLYERMTDAEKASEPGKALANSLQQLKTRLNDTKQSFENVQNQIGEGNGGLGGALEKLGSKIGIPAGAFTTLGGAIAAGAAAVKIAGDAFKQNEVLMDEWGRTTEAAQSVYQGFLNALNTGDFSGFFSRIDEIVSAAKSAYDAMDELGTFTAFNQRNVAKSRAGYAKALDEYRLNPTDANKDALASANEQIKKDLKDSYDKTEDAYQRALQSIAKNKLSSKDLQDAFVKAFSEGNYTDLTEAKASYSKGKGLDMSSYYNGQRVYNGRITDDKGNWRDMTEAEQKQFEFARALSQVTDEEIQKIQALGAQAVQIEEQIHQQDRAYNRLAGNNAPLKTASTSTTTTKTEEKAPEGSIKAMREQLSGLQKDWELATDDDSRKVLKDQIDEVSAALDKMIGKTKEAKPALQIEGPSGYSQEGISALRGEIQGGMKGMQMGSDEYMFQAERLVDLTTFENLLKTAVQRGVTLDPALLESAFEKIDLGVDVKPEEWQNLVDSINEQVNELNPDPVKLDVKTGTVSDAPAETAKATEEGWKAAAGAIQTVGGALQQIEDPGAKVAGIIAQAVANIALSFAEAAASPAVTGTGWGWLGFAAAGISTMIATIASIKSATAGSYAEGGIVPGSSFSGDNLTANVNSGELILNRAQQSNIAGQLNSNPMSNLRLSTEISGSNLRVVLNNDNRQRGGDRNFYSKIH